MTKLSPNAQAVLDAAMKSAIQNLHGTYERDIAAALRAAADQVVPKESVTCNYSRQRQATRVNILNIAAELEKSDV
jgi:hypothetical protein